MLQLMGWQGVGHDLASEQQYVQNIIPVKFRIQNGVQFTLSWCMIVGQRLFLYTISTLVIVHCKEYVMAKYDTATDRLLRQQSAAVGRGSGCSIDHSELKSLLMDLLLYLLAKQNQASSGLKLIPAIHLIAQSVSPSKSSKKPYPKGVGGFLALKISKDQSNNSKASNISLGNRRI